MNQIKITAPVTENEVTLGADRLANMAENSKIFVEALASYGRRGIGGSKAMKAEIAEAIRELHPAAQALFVEDLLDAICDFAKNPGYTDKRNFNALYRLRHKLGMIKG